MKDFIISCSVLGIIFFYFLAFTADENKQSKKENIEPALITNGRIIDIHDGDTVTVVIEKELKIRLLNCWSPELSEEKGIEAREYLKTLIKNGDEVIIKIPLEMDVGKSLTFGRFLATIYKDLNDDGAAENISEEMVKSGHATKTKAKNK